MVNFFINVGLEGIVNVGDRLNKFLLSIGLESIISIENRSNFGRRLFENFGLKEVNDGSENV